MTNKKIFRFIFVVCFSLLFIIIGCLIFFPIYFSNSIIIPYSLKPYDICIKYPDAWNIIKILFIIFYICSCTILFNKIFNFIIKFPCFNKDKNVYLTFDNPNNSLALYVGLSEQSEEIYIR